jgi:hypothetical protein
VIDGSDAAMEDHSFLKALTVLLPAVFGLVLLAAGARSQSSLDGALGVVLLIVAFFFLGVWFVRR